MFRVIIAGSRDFDDYALLQDHADYMLSRQEDIEIVSGGASGADALGERYARVRFANSRISPSIRKIARGYIERVAYRFAALSVFFSRGFYGCPERLKVI